MAEAASKTEQAKFVKRTLDASRAGGGSVENLLVAHEIAQKNNLGHVTAELRQHIHDTIPDPRKGPKVSYDLVIGVVAGFLTTFLLNLVQKKSKHA